MYHHKRKMDAPVGAAIPAKPHTGLCFSRTLVIFVGLDGKLVTLVVHPRFGANRSR